MKIHNLYRPVCTAARSAIRAGRAGAPAVLLATAIIMLSACSSVDFDYPREQSWVDLTAHNSRFGDEINALKAAHPDKSGFYMVNDGIDALAVRLLLAQRAEYTLDVQYYLITNDDIGRLFIAALLQAADRGVRVRLLLDDIQTKGYDAGIAALSSHPNLEVRIFNPFGSRSARFMDAITNFRRINRRMHNKSFTVDNQITIIGGRNIAAEYFSFRDDVNFGDVDVVSIGPVVDDVSAMFDSYWNSEKALPAPAFANMPDDPDAALEVFRTRLSEAIERVKQTPYSEALRADVNKYIDSDPNDDKELFTWAPYKLVYDSPDKADRKKAREAQNITTTLIDTINEANKELIVISPYFVPRKQGIEFFQTLIDRGLSIIVITNSLAANNHGIVHSGYAASRKQMLKMGVKLYETKVTAEVAGVDRGGSGAKLATLHTKAFMVDGQKIFIGSFNWDPRSVYINTELGVVIESETLGQFAAALINQGLKDRTYEVILDNKQRIRWVDRSGEQLMILDKEPDTTWWRRTKAKLGRMLPVRGQL